MNTETKSENSALTFNSKIIQCLALISEMLDECNEDFEEESSLATEDGEEARRITRQRSFSLIEARKHLQQSYK